MERPHLLFYIYIINNFEINRNKSDTSIGHNFGYLTFVGCVIELHEKVNCEFDGLQLS